MFSKKNLNRDLPFLKRLNHADEDMRFQIEQLRPLKKRGWITLHGCSDGDYYKITDLGQQEMEGAQ